MSKLTLVRHGQASFFSGDYDRLSDMGERQARALAQYWLDTGAGFDEVYTGTLLRQQRTAEVAGEVFREGGRPWPQHEVLAGLNEYPADDMMESLLPKLRQFQFNGFARRAFPAAGLTKGIASSRFNVIGPATKRDCDPSSSESRRQSPNPEKPITGRQSFCSRPSSKRWLFTWRQVNCITPLEKHRT